MVAAFGESVPEKRLFPAFLITLFLELAEVLPFFLIREIRAIQRN